MSQKVLFVDDEPHLLEAIKRALYKKYRVDSATSGHEALELMCNNDTYAVIVSDMRMPEMDGLMFLKQCKKKSPDSIRLMLTGNVDQNTAINAVNEGDIFRFLTKPVERHTLMKALDASFKQFRLMQSEKNLLQGTLKGAIQLLMDIMKLNESSMYDISSETEKLAIKVAETLKIKELWQIHYAVILSHISVTTLPLELQLKLKSSEILSEQEKKLIVKLPEVGYRLLNNIPRFNNVAKIILYHKKNFDGSGFPYDGVSGHYLPIESRILKVVFDFENIKKEKDCDHQEALEIIQKNTGKYDPKILENLAWLIENGYLNKNDSSICELYLNDLKPGQRLVSDILTLDGRILLTAGNLLTESRLEKLSSFHLLYKLKEPMRVSEG